MSVIAKLQRKLQSYYRVVIELIKRKRALSTKVIDKLQSKRFTIQRTMLERHISLFFRKLDSYIRKSKNVP